MDGSPGTRLTANIISLCHQASVDLLNDPEGALKTLLVICTGYVDPKELHKMVFSAKPKEDGVVEEKYVDWEAVDMMKESDKHHRSNPLGDTGAWLLFMDLFDFGASLPVSENVLQRSYPPLYCVYNTLKMAGVMQTEKNRPITSAGKQKIFLLKFDDACKLTLLLNINGLTSSTFTERLLSQRLQKNSHDVSARVLAK